MEWTALFLCAQFGLCINVLRCAFLFEFAFAFAFAFVFVFVFVFEFVRFHRRTIWLMSVYRLQSLYFYFSSLWMRK